jgi:hypothetical protein
VIHFDIVIKTKLGALYAAKFARSEEISAVNTESGTKMNINRAHQLQSLKKEKENQRKKGNPLKEGSVFLPFPFCTLQKIEKSFLFLFALLKNWKIPPFPFCTL